MSDKLNHFAVKFPAEMRENVMGLLKKKSQESHGIVAVTRNTSKLFGFATEESQRVWQSALAPLRGQGVQVLLAEGQYAFLKEEPAIPFDAKMLGPLVAPKPVFVAAERIKAIVEAAPPGPAHVESQSTPKTVTEFLAQATSLDFSRAKSRPPLETAVEFLAQAAFIDSNQSESQPTPEAESMPEPETETVAQIAPSDPVLAEVQSTPEPETELVAQTAPPAPIQDEPQPKAEPKATLLAPLSVEDQSKPWYLRYPLIIPDSFKGYKPSNRTLRSIPVTASASSLQPRAKISAPAPAASPKAAHRKSSFARSFPGRHVTEAPALRARRKRALPETESVPRTSEPAPEPKQQPAFAPFVEAAPMAPPAPALKSVPVHPNPRVPLAAAPSYLLSLSSDEFPAKILLCHLEETFGKDSFSLHPKKDGHKKVIETSVPLTKIKKEMKAFDAAVRVLSPADLQSKGRQHAKGR